MVTSLHLQMDQKASAVMLQVNASPSYKVKQSQHHAVRLVLWCHFVLS